jgi:two-component system, OmpR family, sensor kinase
VFADSLSDVQDNVALIRRQVLISGAIALAIAVLAGYFVARALSARVKRLERAARKVAAGDFSQPIRADSVDELGRLAAAFDDMQAQLARLDRARKQFIANASHELRTPIFSLGGFLELLADEDLDEDTRRAFLAQIRGQVDRMRNLAVELLDLSRLEAGALELRPEPTDVGQLAREIAAEFTPAAAQHQSEVTLDLRPEPIELECDPERVAQVLRILLDNALRHTPPGTGVRVSAARSNGHVRLEVSDRGLGINRQNMPHIFEPFFTSNEQAQGAGLGLAIARELAERMQGRLTVRSGPGRTTFSLVLPA